MWEWVDALDGEKNYIMSDVKIKKTALEKLLKDKVVKEVNGFCVNCVGTGQVRNYDMAQNSYYSEGNCWCNREGDYKTVGGMMNANGTPKTLFQHLKKRRKNYWPAWNGRLQAILKEQAKLAEDKRVAEAKELEAEQKIRQAQ